jgi:hypothetical protein
VSSILAGSVCFIALHGNSSDHFATFAQQLSKEQISVQVYAAESMVKRFQDRSIKVVSFSTEEQCVKQEIARVVEACSKALAVIVDVGCPVAIEVMRQLSERSIRRIAYYDNPEPFVPGGYSEVAASVIQLADTVLLANASLTQLESAPGRPIPIEGTRVIGLGYYPVAQAERITARRSIAQREAVRAAFFQQQDLKDKGQKIVVYFGGNNRENFALFPKFLEMLEEEMKHSDLSDLMFVLQQHPGAKSANTDGKALEEWIQRNAGKKGVPKFVLSKGSTEDAQVYANEAWYHQTSMNVQFPLEGLASAQVPGPASDILTRNGFAPSIESAEQFHEAILRAQVGWYVVSDKAAVLAKLGIRPDWAQHLKIAIGYDSIAK